MPCRVKEPPAGTRKRRKATLIIWITPWCHQTDEVWYFFPNNNNTFCNSICFDKEYTPLYDAIPVILLGQFAQTNIHSHTQTRTHTHKQTRTRTHTHKQNPEFWKLFPQLSCFLAKNIQFSTKINNKYVWREKKMHIDDL